MPSNDSNSDLDSRISAIVETTVARMRDELVHRLEGTEARLRDITGRIGGDVAAAVAPEAAAEPPAEVTPASAGDAGSDLFDAIVAMDRGRSQQEILAALLEGVGSFAGRSALFLTRADAAQGWGSYGFENIAGDMNEINVSYTEGPLATLAEGRGCVPLTADQCADICRQMGAAPGAEGLLVPFVLRDRLAAALYVDRFAGSPPLGRRSLQLLAYVGAQAVEGLSLRQRSQTPTLQIATEDSDAPGVALWEAPAAEPPAPEPSVTEPPAAEPPEAEPSLAEPSMIEPVEIEPPVTEGLPSEPQIPEPQIPEPQIPEPQLIEPDTSIDDAPAEMAIEELAEEEAPPAIVTEDLPEIEASLETVEDSLGMAADGELEVPSVALEAPPAEPEPAPAPPVEEPTTPLDALAEPPTEEPQPWAATSGDGFSTVEAETAPEPEVAPPPAEPIGASPGESTEVRPPTDVSGPGWAFTASRAAAESGDDAQHEEARRLARLLVTEIKLYNEEQVEEGRRGNDIYSRLREDIDRSRQIFNERVDETVRQETDYFHDEMVRILAGGNAEALGV